MQHRVTIASSVSHLEHLTDEWRALARHAVETNVFYEPAFFITAYRYFSEYRVIPLFIWKGNELIGFFPLVNFKHWRGIPLSHFQLWRHRYCYLNTPLIHKGFTHECIECLLRWIVSNTSFPHLFEGDMMTANSEFLALMNSAHGRVQTVMKISSQFERALYTVQSSIDDYISTRSKKTIKNYMHKKRLLQSHDSSVVTEFLADYRELPSWSNDFITLEYCSWKGRNGSSLGNSEIDQLFFNEVMDSTFKANQMYFVRIRSNTRTISSKCSLISGETSFAFRIAFDENFFKYSPGWLLEIENCRYLQENQRQIKTMDSCAAPDSKLFYKIWDDKKPIATITSVKSNAFVGVWNQYNHLRGSGKKLRNSLVTMVSPLTNSIHSSSHKDT